MIQQEQPNRIPIVVGVTGHRQIRPADEPILKDAVQKALNALRARCPHSPLVMLTSLAEGADLLCADAARELGVPLFVALPTDAEPCCANYCEADRARFRSHLDSAARVCVAPAVEPVPSIPDTDFFFRQASIYVASHSHVLLALWDGDSAQKDGCGTAAAVHIALSGRFCPAGTLPPRSKKNTGVIRIVLPRTEPYDAVGTVEVLSDAGDILDRTDAFNRRCPTVPSPFADEPDPVLVQMGSVYAGADALSMAAAKTYRRVLALLAAIGTVLTVSFLLYDEAELYWMILMTGAMLALAVFVYRFALRSDCHRRYLDCRVLAESLRVQANLRYAGSGTEVPSLLPLTQRSDTAWVLCALCALCIGEPPKQGHSIRKRWVEEQQLYHERAIPKAERQRTHSERVVRIALIGSAVLYVGALVFELVVAFSKTGVSDPNVFRAGLKIVLGSLSAATLFIANYYGKQSLSRKLSDHAKMAAFYRTMNERMALYGETESQLELLAREELIENGHWYAYQSDNAPDLSF